MRDKRGFTLIELIVVLGLASIVISVVMSFFIANFKSYEAINTESEAQYQSQYIINFMTDKILGAESFEGHTGSVFKFKNPDGKEITFEGAEERVRYRHGTDAPVLIGNYVKTLNIESSGAGEITITLILENGNKEYFAEQIVYMRNSPN